MIARYYSQLPFKTKLTAIITAISAAAITLVCVGIIFYDLTKFGQELESKHQNLLKIVNNNISAAIIFEDTTAINSNLKIYKFQQEVIRVDISSQNGDLIAHYTGKAEPAIFKQDIVLKDDTISDFYSEHLYVQEPIRLDGVTIGYSQAYISLEKLNDMVWLYIEIGLAVMSIALLAAFITARKLARVFSGPIENLVEAAKKITKSADYSIRVPNNSDDEIGHLSTYFNSMLDEIEHRDTHLHHQRATLEKRVRQKTQKLQQALDDAQIASQSKSEFLANMSHELRTPLNAILGFSEIMQLELFGKHSSPKYMDYVKLINDSGIHLLDIINDLLDLAKIEAGKVELVIEPTDITDLLAEISGMMQVWARKKKQSLVLDIQQQVPLVPCDRRMMKQAFLNLVSNAIKFTPKGGNIKITMKQEQPDFLTILFSDTGNGMTESEIREAMKPFGQAQSILSRSHEGTGLGLPLVEQYLKLHGAEMHIQSSPREGTDIRVLLPLETL